MSTSIVVIRCSLRKSKRISARAMSTTALDPSNLRTIAFPCPTSSILALCEAIIASRFGSELEVSKVDVIGGSRVQVDLREESRSVLYCRAKRSVDVGKRYFDLFVQPPARNLDPGPVAIEILDANESSVRASG